MANYFNLVVVPVPKANIDAYRKQAELFATIWKEHGALDCVEIEGDDIPAGKVTSFPLSVALKPDETIFVGIMQFRSRAHRDEVSGRAMKDPRLAGMTPKTMPFDPARLFWGGFKPFL